MFLRVCYLLIFTVTTTVPVQAATSTIFGSSQNALACYQMAKRLSQTNQELLTSTVECDLALDELLGAKDRASTLVNRGLIYARQERFELALQDYEAAIALSERIKPTAFINIGNAHFLQRDFSTAQRFYSRALDLNVTQAHAATLNRGMASEKLGHLEAAEADYLAALELVPEWDSAQLRLDRVRNKLAATPADGFTP
jgi:tetratricopeptide (TPR) repeat protein